MVSGGIARNLEVLTTKLNHMCRGMSRDTNYYEDPERFDPNRHLGDSKQLDPYRYVFGFGRRYASHRHHPFVMLNREDDLRLITNGLIRSHY